MSSRAAGLTLVLLASCRCGSKAEPSAAAAPPVATCAKAKGEVQVRRAGTPFFELLAAGSVLRAGDWVRTGKASFARLAFLSGGELELDAESAVRVDLAAPVEDAGAAVAGPEVALQDGQVHGFLAAGPGLPPLVFRGKDGTELRLGARPGAPLEYRVDGRSQGIDVAVLRGEATLVVNGIERVLREGHLSYVLGGKAGEPQALIEFPESVEPGIDARFLFSPGMSIRIEWAPVPGASGYRLQVARDLSFHDVELSLDSPSTQLTFTPSDPGFYAWRVASRDGERRLGEYGFARRIFCEAEVPHDLLLAPADGETLPTSAPTASVDFSWQSAADATSYRLVVARVPDLLQQPLVDRTVTDQRFRVSGLAPGAYYWGIYLNDQMPRPLFLQPRRFQVKRVAAARLDTVKSINRWGE
ncbi:MAG: FecR family protein [Myxococcales bacterium]